MKKYFLIIVLFSFSIFISSCNKEDEETTKDFITARWQGETLTINTSFGGLDFTPKTEDISMTFVDFNSNGTYTADNNGVFGGSGTWRLSNGDKEIILDEGTDDEAIFTITSITSNDLKLSFSEEETEGQFPTTVTGVLDLKK